MDECGMKCTKSPRGLRNRHLFRMSDMEESFPRGQIRLDAQITWMKDGVRPRVQSLRTYIADDLSRPTPHTPIEAVLHLKSDDLYTTPFSSYQHTRGILETPTYQPSFPLPAAFYNTNVLFYFS